MDSSELIQFIQFLQTELDVSEDSLQLALRHPEQTLTLLPMILWQYGSVTLTQLDQMFEWLEHRVEVKQL